MDAVKILLVVLGGVVAAIGNSLRLGDHKIPALWCYWAGAVIASAVFPVWYQKVLVKQRAAVQQPPAIAPAPDSPLAPGDGPMPDSAFEIVDYEPPNEPRSMKQFIPSGAFRIYFGNNIAWTQSIPYVLIAQRGERLIALEHAADGIYLSAKFFDAAGKIVCEIAKNQIYPKDGNYFRLEQTPHRLRVFDDEARLTIDVNYVNPNALEMFGDFYLREGLRVILQKDGTRFGDKLIDECIAASPYPYPAVVIWIDQPPGGNNAALMKIDYKDRAN